MAETIGDRIKRARLERKMTQEQLAQKCGVKGNPIGALFLGLVGAAWPCHRAVVQQQKPESLPILRDEDPDLRDNLPLLPKRAVATLI